MTLDPSLAAYAQQWLANLSVDLSRYAVFAIAVWLVIWAGPWRAARSERRRPRRAS
ncbi:MAG TPA: hypothetical protein VFE03_03500 [Caulobacteraceae bacterium]|jgi:hypothetical protein|nr:hypothetical protein [Caulobacteraceae bacterium]